MTWMSWSASHGPKKPWRAEKQDEDQPGDDRRYRKRQVDECDRNWRPGNSKRAIAHAAAMPKTRFSGTAMSAAISVSRNARHASGSLTAK